MQFLNEHAFQTPTSLIDPDILDRLESHGAADRILNSQRSAPKHSAGDRMVTPNHTNFLENAIKNSTVSARLCLLWKGRPFLDNCQQKMYGMSN